MLAISEIRKRVLNRVARWFVFKPKIPIWENFGGPWIGKCFYILWSFGICYGYLRYFMTIWYILCSFGTFCFGIMYQEKSGNTGFEQRKTFKLGNQFT
jgi:hypothetical protein